MASQPPDYFGAMGGAQNMVDPSAAVSRGLMDVLRPQAMAAQGELYSQQARQLQIGMARQQAFTNAAAGYAANPTPDGLRQLFSFPEYAEAAKQMYDVADEQQKRTNTTQLGSAMALAARGDYAGAATIAQARYDADKRAGIDNPALKNVIDLLNGTPAQQREATATIAAHLAGSIGVDAASKFMEENGLSNKPVPVKRDEGLYNPSTGQTIVAPHAPLAVSSVKLPGGKEYPVAVNVETGQVGPQGAGAAPVGAPASPIPTGAPLLQAMIPITAASESGNRDFNRDGSPVVSPKGAKGRMQVMPGTNADPGFGVRPAADNSPEERTRVGQDYLAAMVQRYGGDPAKAWAAYNAGPGRVDRALAKGGDWFSKMPADTRKYVMANMSQLRGPQTAMAGTGAASDAMPGASPAGASGGPAAAPSDVPSRLDPNTGLPVGGVAPLNTEGAPTGYAWNAQHTAVEPVPGGEQDLSSYPPAMIHDAAVELLTTGQMPSMGMGGAAIKKAILDERSRIMQQAGISADQLPTFRARYGADKAALQNISGIVNGLQASESALLANLHQVHVTQQQLVHDGIIGDTPFLNKGRLAWARRFGTSEQKAHIKAYEDALNAGQTEYAKFMSTQSGMGNAPTTDSARGRAGELLDEEDAPAATLAGLRQLQIEAANKKNGVLQQRQALEQKLSGYLQPQGPGTAAQVRTIQQYNALPKGARYIDPNGVHRVKQ